MTKASPFRYFRTSPEIIGLAVMMYVRFPLSLRKVEDLLHERAIDVSLESVRFASVLVERIKKLSVGVHQLVGLDQTGLASLKRLLFNHRPAQALSNGLVARQDLHAEHTLKRVPRMDLSQCLEDLRHLLIVALPRHLEGIQLALRTS